MTKKKRGRGGQNQGGNNNANQPQGAEGGGGQQQVHESQNQGVHEYGNQPLGGGQPGGQQQNRGTMWGQPGVDANQFRPQTTPDASNAPAANVPPQQPQVWAQPPRPGSSQQGADFNQQGRGRGDRGGGRGDRGGGRGDRGGGRGDRGGGRGDRGGGRGDRGGGRGDRGGRGGQGGRGRGWSQPSDQEAAPQQPGFAPMIPQTSAPPEMPGFAWGGGDTPAPRQEEPVRPKRSQQASTGEGSGSGQAQMSESGPAMRVEDIERPETLFQFKRALNISIKQPIRRPDKGGSFGRKVTLITNHFELIMNNPPECYHYDVEIEPRMSADKKREVFAEFLKSKMGLEHVKDKFVFDGQKNVYSCHKIDPLPPPKCQVEYINVESGRQLTATVSIQFAADVDLTLIERYIKSHQDQLEKPQQCLNVLNTAYKQLCIGMADFVTLRRATFSKPTGRPLDMTGGLDLWFGYQPSIVMGTWKVYLQIDITSKGFTRETNLIDYLGGILNIDPRKPLNYNQLHELKRALSGYKVKTSHTNFTKKIVDFTENAHKVIRDTNETVLQYFETKYKIRLQYPHLPLVRMQPKEKDICIPMELCSLRGEQPALKKLDERQQTEMVKATAMDPSKRNQMIMEMLKMKTKPNGSKIMQSFNMRVIEKMPEIEGRVLPGPWVFGNRQRQQSRGGKYQSVDFNKPSQELRGYVIISPRRLQDKIDPMHQAFSREASKQGMSWPQRYLTVLNFDDRDTRTLGQALNQVTVEYKRNPNSFNLVIILLFLKNPEVYSMAKHILDNEHQIVSQVLLQRTISGRAPGQPPNPMSINQILLKLNTKLSGINAVTFRDYMGVIEQSDKNRITTDQYYATAFKKAAEQFEDIFKEPFMVFGADVTHPDPGDHGKPSISAVIGSLNSTLTRYGAQIRVQKSRQEMIQGMKEMFMNLLKEFREKTGHFPQRIIYYRDGVSEGQFSEVLVEELNAMQSACKDLNPNFTPKLTFIVVNKRHKARFFNWGRLPKSNTEGIINVEPGTVIDVDIVHPFQFDFYLCSHEGIKGTSRPAHYHVLYDDSEFTSDTLQSFTFALCHLYARCTRAVSYPPPTYYAHHAAMRARHHVSYLMRSYAGSDSGHSSGSGESEGADPRLIEFLNQHLVPACEKLLKKYPMYFV